jgi:hypothetical protein
VLGVLAVGTGALLFHETRGTTLFFDEWTWLIQRRGGGLSSFLDTNNGHLSLIPVAIYKLLFATVGIRHSAPYRALVIAGDLACSALLFAYARRRVGAYLAVLAAAVIMLFGPGWENLLWSFQITWQLSLCAGLGAFLALDRHDRSGDVAACVLLVGALASSGIGVPIVLGAAVEVALTRRRRDTWIVVVPLALYALWSIGYQHTSVSRLGGAPNWVYTSAAATLSALAGLSGVTGLDGQGSLMTWGPALLVAALIAVALRLVRIRRLDSRVAALMTIALSFWVLTAVTRAFITTPFASRYLYVGAVFLLLIAVELGRGVRLSRWPAVAVGGLALAAVVSNVAALRDAGRLLRVDGVESAADLGALEIGRPVMPPGYIASALPGYPLVLLPAAGYFDAERSVGTPALSAAQIAVGPEPGRVTADTELVRIHRLALVAAGKVTIGSAPAIDSVLGGTIVRRGTCVAFAPGRFAVAGAPVEFAVTAPPGGLLLTASGGPATVAVRRFGDTFRTLGTLAPGGPAALAISSDRSSQPWHVQVGPTGRATVCGLAP